MAARGKGGTRRRARPAPSPFLLAARGRRGLSLIVVVPPVQAGSTSIILADRRRLSPPRHKQPSLIRKGQNQRPARDGAGQLVHREGVVVREAQHTDARGAPVGGKPIVADRQEEQRGSSVGLRRDQWSLVLIRPLPRSPRPLKALGGGRRGCSGSSRNLRRLPRRPCSSCR